MRKGYVLIAIVILFTFLTLACGGGGEWSDWQKDVLDRQRDGLPTDTPTPVPTGE